MIDTRIRWPVKVIHTTDPELNFDADSPNELEVNIEYWNDAEGLGDDDVELVVANGHKLTGVIQDLKILDLRIC